MATLYDLDAKYQELLHVAENMDEEALQDTLDSIEDSQEVKFESYAIVDKKLEAEEEMFSKEIKRLQHKKNSIKNNRKRIKDSLYNSMKITGKERVQTDKFNFWIQNNPPKLVVHDEKKIPKKYWVEQAPVIDKRALMEDLKKGDSEGFEGASIEQGEGMRFR